MKQSTTNHTESLLGAQPTSSTTKEHSTADDDAASSADDAEDDVEDEYLVESQYGSVVTSGVDTDSAYSAEETNQTDQGEVYNTCMYAACLCKQ